MTDDIRLCVCGGDADAELHMFSLTHRAHVWRTLSDYGPKDPLMLPAVSTVDVLPRERGDDAGVTPGGAESSSSQLSGVESTHAPRAAWGGAHS